MVRHMPATSEDKAGMGGDGQSGIGVTSGKGSGSKRETGGKGSAGGKAVAGGKERADEWSGTVLLIDAGLTPDGSRVVRAGINIGCANRMLSGTSGERSY